MNVPQKTTNNFFKPLTIHSAPLPLFAGAVKAGFPSPADDFIEKRLDLNEYLIPHPAATFFVRVDGESMAEAGIHSGDILVVDRSLEASNGRIVVAIVDGAFTVKRLRINQRAEGQEIFLEPENENFQPLRVDPASDFQIWGIVTYVIHKAIRTH